MCNIYFQILFWRILTPLRIFEYIGLIHIFAKHTALKNLCQKYSNHNTKIEGKSVGILYPFELLCSIV